MDNIKDLRLNCKHGDVLTVEDGVIISTNKGQSERFPIRMMQSITFREGKFLSDGALAFKIGSNTGSLNLGMGIGIGLGGQKIFLFHERENEKARQIHKYICDFQEHPDTAEQESPKVQSVVAVADEIRELKSLLDDGIITQEDFDAKKKQLLGI
jgi:hypothetical protein